MEGPAERYSRELRIHGGHVLGLEAPKDGDYKFEYAVPGDKGTDFIDLYKRGSFVLEAKQSRAKGCKKAVDGENRRDAPSTC